MKTPPLLLSLYEHKEGEWEESIFDSLTKRVRLPPVPRPQLEEHLFMDEQDE